MSRPIGERRICLRCGSELPATCSISRKYCDACGKQRNIELTIRRKQTAKAYYEKQRAEKQDAADREYCKPCTYYGSEEYGGNLCDYLLKTGHRRGCKAGVGCNMREV